MAYPMTQWGQPSPLRQVQRVPGFGEQFGPTVLNLLGQLGLQKMGQNWKAGQAELEAGRQEQAAGAVREFEMDKLNLQLGSKERIAGYKTDKDYELKWLDLKSEGLVEPGSLQDASTHGPPSPGEIPRPLRFGGGTSRITPAPREYKPGTPEEALKLKRAGRAPTVQEGKDWVWILDEDTGKFRQTQVPATEKQKAAKNFMFSDGRTVLSYDDGRTYIDEAGRKVPMPSDAIRFMATGTEANLIKAKQRAQEGKEEGKPSLPGLPSPSGLPSPEEAALGGTGPWRMLAAAVDAFAGGLGVDRIWGGKGLFPETQENRQALRMLKVKGYTALKNSTRGAVWDQERIDDLFPNPKRLWRNPRTEARKLDDVRSVLATTKALNIQGIENPVSVGEIQKLRASNREIDALLALLTPSTTESIFNEEEETLLNKYAPSKE